MTEWSLIQPQHLDAVFIAWYTWDRFSIFAILALLPYGLLYLVLRFGKKPKKHDRQTGFQKFVIVCCAAYAEKKPWDYRLFHFTLSLLLLYLILHACMVANPNRLLVEGGGSLQYLGVDEINNLLRFLIWWFIAGVCVVVLSYVAIVSYLTIGLEILRPRSNAQALILTYKIYRDDSEMVEGNLIPCFETQRHLHILDIGSHHTHARSESELRRRVLILEYIHGRGWFFKKGDAPIEVKYGNETVSGKTLIKREHPYTFNWSATQQVDGQLKNIKCEVYVK